MKWQLVPILLITVLFAVTQYSNANTHLSALQKPGNYHDDSRLTNTVREADTLSAAINDIKWGYQLVAPVYYLKHFFNIETNGRRIIASLLVLSSLIYLLIILARYGVLDNIGLLFFAFIFSISGELTIYTSTGLLSYPLLIFISAFLIHVLLRYYGHALSIRDYFTICTVFTLAVLLNSRSILAVCAVGFALSVGLVLQQTFSRSGLLAGMRYITVLLIVPISAVTLLLYLDAPSELANPYRGMQFYFFTSNYPSTILGAFTFFIQNSANLFYSAISPHPFVFGKSFVIWVSAILGFFFLAVFFSFDNKKSFAIVLFFLAGTLSHIILNSATLVPYGNLRYFLPFFVAFPLITAIGITKVTQAVLARLKNDQAAIWPHRAYIFVAVMLFAILFRYQYTNNKLNTAMTNNVVNGIATTELAHKNKNTAIVLDVWTVDTLKGDQWGVADDASYVLNTHIKTAWRGQLPEDQDDLEKWRLFLDQNRSFTAITSISFSKKYYGSLYEAASEQFEITSRPNAPAYHFTEFSKRE